MLKINTGYKPVNADPARVFAFLADMNNLEKLMPEQVINWKSDTDTCTYTIKGMADIGMQITDRNPDSSVSMSSFGKVPFNFTLVIRIRPVAALSEAGLEFEGDVNPFLKMMVEKPLGNFFNMLVDNLNKQF
jgi:carbon monoxide dehydrogenase subunit G